MWRRPRRWRPRCVWTIWSVWIVRIAWCLPCRLCKLGCACVHAGRSLLTSLQPVPLQLQVMAEREAERERRRQEEGVGEDPLAKLGPGLDLLA